MPNISYPVDYLRQLKMQGLGTAAAKLLELGFAADAVLPVQPGDRPLGRDRPPTAPSTSSIRKRLSGLFQRRAHPRARGRHSRRAGRELDEAAPGGRRPRPRANRPKSSKPAVAGSQAARQSPRKTSRSST